MESRTHGANGGLVDEMFFLIEHRDSLAHPCLGMVAKMIGAWKKYLEGDVAVLAKRSSRRPWVQVCITSWNMGSPTPGIWVPPTVFRFLIRISRGMGFWFPFFHKSFLKVVTTWDLYVLPAA